jgi:uncharacterized protein (TIGR03067 family)
MRIILTAALALATAAGQSTRQTDDLHLLSGTFVIVRFERDGTPTPEAELKTMRIEQQGRRWRFFLGDDVTEGTDSVDPLARPRAIDSLYNNGPWQGQVSLGIYDAAGDTVRYCHAEPGKPRPTDFSTAPGSGRTLMVLKRVRR